MLGIGEIGLNKNTRNEMTVLERHVDLAARHDQLILVHTPHLEDKLKGTRLILDVLKADSRDSAGARDHRSRGGAHGRHRARCGFLGGHHALSRIEMHARARAIDMVELCGMREYLAELRVRLGPQRAARRAADRAGDAQARPLAGGDRRSHLRQPAAVPFTEPAVQAAIGAPEDGAVKARRPLRIRIKHYVYD